METLPVEYPPANQCPGKKEKRVRVEFFSREIVFRMSSTQSVSWNRGDFACRIPSTKSMSWKKGKRVRVFVLQQSVSWNRGVKAIFLQVETLPVEDPPQNQCPGKKEKRVRVIVLQQRHRLEYVVHPVSVLDSGDIACRITPPNQCPETRKSEEELSSSAETCLAYVIHPVSVLEQGRHCL